MALKRQIERLDQEKDESVFAQDFELAAQVRDRLEKTKDKRDHVIAEWRRSTKEVDGAVGAESISATVSQMTGIPIGIRIG